MSEPQSNPSPEGSARRRLLRGAFSAPAVLAVYSTGANAATSLGAALVRANATPTTVGIGVTSLDDVMLRYRLYGLVNSGGQVYSYWIRGADLSVLQRNGQLPFLGAAQFQRFDVNNNLLVASTVTSTTPSQGQYVFQATNKYVVLRINSTGAVVGAGSTGAGAPVSDSSWTSFAVAAGP